MVPGSVLAEIEHGALTVLVDRRPWPSRLLLWWGLWAAGVLLSAFTAGVVRRTGVRPWRTVSCSMPSWTSWPH